MASDIELIINRLAMVRPDIRVHQLKVTNPADNDGLWILIKPGGTRRVQLESWTYNFPFTVEADHVDGAFTVTSVKEAVDKVTELLDQ